MQATELHSFLHRLETYPKKGLSQNFLVDPSIVEKIIQLAEVQPDEAVLEIGPGAGALTAALLQKGAKVYAIELDSMLARELHRLQNGKLTVLQGDILKFPLTSLPPNLKIVANLPYHITTPILEKIFAGSFTSLTIMVQREVADRMVASAGFKTFGALSLFVQFYTQLHAFFAVDAGCFYPAPKVTSTVIRLDRRSPPAVDPSFFFSLVRTAFQKRRKMISGILPYPKETLKTVLSQIGMREDARPEMLSLEKWVELALKLPPHP